MYHILNFQPQQKNNNKINKIIYKKYDDILVKDTRNKKIGRNLRRKTVKPAKIALQIKRRDSRNKDYFVTNSRHTFFFYSHDIILERQQCPIRIIIAIVSLDNSFKRV